MCWMRYPSPPIINVYSLNAMVSVPWNECTRPECNFYIRNVTCQQLVSVRLPQELPTTGPSLPLIVVSCCIVSAESAVYLVNEGGWWSERLWLLLTCGHPKLMTDESISPVAGSAFHFSSFPSRGIAFHSFAMCRVEAWAALKGFRSCPNYETRRFWIGL
jgi:hypothetical protein